MSKMPAKKKSCFQITSVTTAQAASSITEDTESLDDPDESHTEDVSSEIFDVSRATDYGPEEVVERSSSEETLNNVGGEADTPGTMSPNMPHEAPLIRSGPPPSQASPAPQACSSRFRVIKLDHSSGEPYRRGRWTCTEYYDKDSDGSTLISRHTGGSTYEHSAPDRDSGLGGSVAVVSSIHHDSGVDTTLNAVSQILQLDKINQPWQQPIQGTAQPMHPAPVSSQPMMVPPPGQTYLPNLGAPQNVSLAQPGTQQTNTSVSQAQQFPYSQPGLVMTPQASGQAEYGQHRTVIQSQGTTQNAASSLIAGTGAPSSLPGQHLPAPLLGLHSKPNDSAGQGSGLGTHPVHMQQAGGGVEQTTLSSIGAVPQQSICQQQAGGSSILGSHHAMPPGVQNVPVAVPSTGVSGPSSSVSTIPVTMPIAPATFVQSSLSSHASVSRSNSLIPTVGLPPVQGTANVNTSLPQSNISQFQTQPLAGQIDDRRKSEPLPQPSMSLISEKSFVKVPIMDTLTNPLHLPVFGLPIPVDGEDDSSSSANVVAIDNKIEQAMDLVKSHLMYAVREEVEVLKEQIKELIEKNSTLERENLLLKSLSNSDQLSQLSTPAGLSQQQPPVTTAPLTAPQTAHPPQQPNVSSA
ncbi:TSC22 domain family protein 2 isoform X2 [Rana temporaria]|uniref:TSC22 domain family protein 2 isoform X2 n=1 Tax=Rana temporaria TaxID=8407 RepID=UPI001AAC7C6E|nr:TSC22 domain family protein 2 isoform X2 [Rana temporaria]